MITVKDAHEMWQIWFPLYWVNPNNGLTWKVIDIEIDFQHTTPREPRYTLWGEDRISRDNILGWINLYQEGEIKSEQHS